jgi:hypothetical protein
MDNSFMVGLSAQQVLQKRMDTTANNLANMTTAGFKVEHLVTRDLTEKPAAASDTPNDISFADAWMLQRDFSTGPDRADRQCAGFRHRGRRLLRRADGRRARPIRAMDAFSLNEQGQVVTAMATP